MHTHAHTHILTHTHAHAHTYKHAHTHTHIDGDTDQEPPKIDGREHAYGRGSSQLIHTPIILVKRVCIVRVVCGAALRDPLLGVGAVALVHGQ